MDTDLVAAYKLGIKHAHGMPETGGRVEWLLKKFSGMQCPAADSLRRVAKDKYERLVLAEALGRLSIKGESARGQET